MTFNPQKVRSAPKGAILESGGSLLRAGLILQRPIPLLDRARIFCRKLGIIRDTKHSSIESLTIQLAEFWNLFIPFGKDEAHYFKRFRELVQGRGLLCHKKQKGGQGLDPVPVSKPDTPPGRLKLPNANQSVGRTSQWATGIERMKVVRLSHKKVIPYTAPKPQPVLDQADLDRIAYQEKLKAAYQAFKKKEESNTLQLIYDPFKKPTSHQPEASSEKETPMSLWMEDWEDEYRILETPLNECDQSRKDCYRYNSFMKPKKAKNAAPPRSHLEDHWKSDLRDLARFYERCPDKQTYPNLPQYVVAAYAKAASVPYQTIIQWSKGR